MKLSVKISTIFTFIIVQALLSICFYIDDDFISRWESVSIVILGILLTYFVNWFRELNSVQKDQDNQ